MRHSDLILVKRSQGRGRGVFARAPIAAGTVIEKVPVLLLPREEIRGGARLSSLARFCFVRNRSTVALALGYGSLYNHSYTPNAQYEEEPGAMVFRALRPIEPGEEITINYNGDPDDPSPVGFPVR
ncbi:MAG: SET domain-containing protein-lysine N-methyltransferase [Planctomycetes bacterium]|nr:SET domain-containing protein-lysine N-methyltransferase [Planctomycetota bacterium]